MLLLLVILYLLPFQMDALPHEESSKHVLNRGQRWISSYEPYIWIFIEVDHNNDDVLTRQDMDQFFNKVDNDGDDIITRDDFKRFFSRYPLDGEDPDSVFNTFDSDGDGLLTKGDRMYLDIIENDGLTYKEFLQFIEDANAKSKEEHRPLPNGPYKELFSYVDTNHDGIVTAPEVDRFVRKEDADGGNKGMTLGEFVDFYTSKIRNDEDFAVFLFDLLDSYKDGVLTPLDRVYIYLYFKGPTGGLSLLEYLNVLEYQYNMMAEEEPGSASLMADSSSEEE